MIAIIDYGMGNINSIYKAMKKIGAEVTLTNDKKVIRDSKGIIIPGVGDFKKAMENLKSMGLDTIIKEEIEKGKPMLGICLGMQLVFDSSEEMGYSEGLGLIPGKVTKFQISKKIPHIGWNSVRIKQNHPIFKGIDDGEYFYFVHSFHGNCDEKYILGDCNYEVDFPAIVGRDNIVASQFHPEKSGEVGLKLLKNFKEMVG